MITEKLHTKLSRFLSLVLRHKPETIGLELDQQGYAEVDLLIKKMNQYGKNIDLETLQYIVATNNKKRYAFNEAGDKIRANQGHSIKVDLGYTPQTPPAILYHGSARRFVSSIFNTGLDKRKRHHVHLSADLKTASKVGQRHGQLVIFEVLAKEMHEAGFSFYVSTNGVWLTDKVPVQYLRSQE